MPMIDPPHPMAPGCHQRVFCHSPVFPLEETLVSDKIRVGDNLVGRESRARRRPQGVPHFSPEGMHY